MLTLSTLSFALFVAAVAPTAPPTLEDVIATAGGPDVRINVVKVHNAPTQGCIPQRVVRPEYIRVSGPTPFVLQGRDAKGRVCQTLVRATIHARALVQTVKRDVAVGQKVSPKDFEARWVPIEQAHGKLRHPVLGAAQTRVKKNTPIGLTSFAHHNPGLVQINLIDGTLTIKTSGQRGRCRGNVNADVACVRLENGQRFRGRVGPDGTVTVVLP